MQRTGNIPLIDESHVSRLLDGIEPFYIDDLLMFSKDKENHYNHLEIVLFRVQENELYASPKKCKFMRDGIFYTGESKNC